MDDIIDPDLFTFQEFFPLQDSIFCILVMQAKIKDPVKDVPELAIPAAIAEIDVPGF
ncbi:hypothetical protein [Zeaxanthinibacter enoshimensis]|uniref:hypothetical protein n=1 Tax=Zeaxanthinibacter enoshimensis TaxID=392009 RepID=UPI0029394EAA|nr:hypothetical protein [Zeaxanthinibacter enoshimensis]